MADDNYSLNINCPLTCCVMKDPVVDREGNSYERVAIEEWLAVSMTSPITRNPLTRADLAPNRTLKNLIDETIATVTAAAAAEKEKTSNSSSSSRGSEPRLLFSVKLESIDDIISCPACKQEFTASGSSSLDRTPKVLDCFHCFCTTCLVSLVESRDSIACPLCSTSTDMKQRTIDDLTTNFAIGDLLRALKSGDIEEHSNFANNSNNSNFTGGGSISSEITPTAPPFPSDSASGGSMTLNNNNNNSLQANGSLHNLDQNEPPQSDPNSPNSDGWVIVSPTAKEILKGVGKGAFIVGIFAASPVIGVGTLVVGSLVGYIDPSQIVHDFKDFNDQYIHITIFNEDSALMTKVTSSAAVVKDILDIVPRTTRQIDEKYGVSSKIDTAIGFGKKAALSVAQLIAKIDQLNTKYEVSSKVGSAISKVLGQRR